MEKGFQRRGAEGAEDAENAKGFQRRDAESAEDAEEAKGADSPS
jgi:hypothetical protein